MVCVLLSRLGGFDTDHQNGATVRATVQFHIPGPAPVALVAAEQRVKQATYQMTMTVRVAFLRLFRRTSDVIFPFSGALQAAEVHMRGAPAAGTRALPAAQQAFALR